MTTREQVRAAMHRQPFVGFTVNLSSGQSFYVKHPDFIILHIDDVSAPQVASMAGTSAEGNGP